MARDRHRQTVGAAGLCHGPDGFGRADPLGDLGIAGGAADRDFPQGLPDPLLKRGALHIQRQVQADRRRFDKTDHPGNQLLELLIGANQIGAPEPVLQIADQLLWIIAQQNRAHSALTLRHQNRAE